MKAIIIATTNGREQWLEQCLESLEGYTRYPKLVTMSGDWELGKIKNASESMVIDEFIFLQDSMVIKDYKWIDEAFDYHGSVSIGWRPFFMYLGKYKTDILRSIEIPKVNNKLDAVNYEYTWPLEYIKADPSTKHIFTDLTDTNIFLEKFGRMNMVLENDQLIKYKGTWSLDMVKD